MSLIHPEVVPLQPHDFGWVAGIIDMKGLIARKKNPSRATTQNVLVVDTKNRDVIVRLAKYTGTDPAIQQEKRIKDSWRRKGCADHCPSQHVHVREVSMPQISRWQITGVSLATVAFNVLPYLTDSDRTRDIIAAVEEIASTIPLMGPGRGAIDAALRRLANLGWEIPDYLLPTARTLF